MILVYFFRILLILYYVILGVKNMKKRVHGNEKIDLPCAFLECVRSLHFTLLFITNICEFSQL